MTVQELIDHLQLMMLTDGLRPESEVTVVTIFGEDEVTASRVYFDPDDGDLVIDMLR